MSIQSLHSRIDNLILAAALLAAPAFAGGCAAPSRIAYVADGAESHGAPSTDVEVLLDSAPERPFVVTGNFTAHTFSNPQSVELMRTSAKEAGLDGIYWIDCTSTCSGHCTAKGFVYRDRGMAKGMSGAQIASK